MSSNKEQESEEVVANLRACLISTKGKCDLKQINNDYKLLMGSPIPYQRLGHSTLEKFICSISTLKTSRSSGILYVEAAQTEKSSHISKLVNKQRSSKKRSSRRVWPSLKTKWQPKTVTKTYHNSPRPAAVKHNQFVKRATSPVRSTLSARFASRLGPRASPPAAEDGDKHLDAVFTKAKERLSKRMEDININDGGYGSDSPTSDMANSASSLFGNGIYHRKQSDPEAFSWPSDFDAKINSDFVSPPVKKEPVPFIRTGNPLDDLQMFAKIHNLGEPQVTVMSRTVRPRKTLCYDCKIKVGSRTYSSYPKDFYAETEAKLETALKALEDLILLHDKKDSLSVSNNLDVLDRIPSMVQSHFHGIWKEQLESDYAVKYNEQLPIDWLQIADSLPNLSVTPCLDKFVLRFCKPGEGFQKDTSKTFSYVSHVSVPTNSANFDSKGSLMAEITCPMSASEIWCRQINTADAAAFGTMIGELDSYNTFEKVDSVDVGGYYLALADDGRVWCRVRVFDSTDEVINCFCIDYGDELTVKLSEIYRLPRQFAREQAQAFVCRLVGVEEFYEASKKSDYITNLSGKVVNVNLQDNDFADDFTHNVILVDVEDGAIINEEIIEYIENAMYKTPKFKNDTPMEVYLTHAEDSGLVYVKKPYFGTTQLEILLSDLENLIQTDTLGVSKAHLTPTNSKDKLYLVKSSSNSWLRTRILDWSPIQKEFAQIQYVDSGVTTIVNVNETVVYLLDELNPAVVKFEDQAEAGWFGLENIPDNFSGTIKKLIPGDQLVLVKVAGFRDNGLPIFRFFKRSEPDGLLFSINDAITATKTEAKNSLASGRPSQMSSRIQKLMSLNQTEDTKIPSTGCLPAPPFPKQKEFFEIRVRSAVNPYNFFVQPLSSMNELIKLMKDLQAYCEKHKYIPLSISDIIPGKIYGFKFNDSVWYRTSVIKVINPGSISVFHCDYGIYTNLTLHQLVQIDEDFCTFPYQAIKAKLAGVQPVQSTWSMDDCKYFEQLVSNKDFVSLLIGTEKDPFHKCDTVLSLKIADTSTEADIFLDQLLISKGIAVAPS